MNAKMRRRETHNKARMMVERLIKITNEQDFAINSLVRLTSEKDALIREFVALKLPFKDDEESDNK